MKFLKEIIILIIQLVLFYVFPLFAGPTDAMGIHKTKLTELLKLLFLLKTS